MKNWNRSIIFSILAIVVLCLAGCTCGKAASDMPTEQVAAPPAVVEKEPVAQPEPVSGLAAAAAAAGALMNTYFDFDKSNLTPEAIGRLDKTAAWMQQNPEVKVEIAGHCDERGTNEYNMALGERRANSAKKYLVSMGIASDRLSTMSYGEERPADSGRTEAAWAKNRRNEYRIVE